MVMPKQRPKALKGARQEAAAVGFLQVRGVRNGCNYCLKLFLLLELLTTCHCLKLPQSQRLGAPWPVIIVISPLPRELS